MESPKPIDLFMALCDVTDIRARGGSPYYLLSEGKKAGFIKRGAPLDMKAVKMHRYLWNLSQILIRLNKGGFQYTDIFAEKLFSKAGITPPTGPILSQFPLFPPDSWLKRTSLNFYIDATLKQNFNNINARELSRKKIQRDAISREKERYQEAGRIVCMAKWAAESLIDSYGIHSSKVYVIPGGANLGKTGVNDFDKDPAVHQVLRLGFVGKDWRRKNLPLLLEIAEHINRLGQPVEVAAAGFPREKGPRHPLLIEYGLIDKRKSPEFFSEFLLQSHFGCLFSHREPFGLSNREFLNVGVPVLTWDIGGLPDTVPVGSGFVFSSKETSLQIAEAILDNWKNWEGYLKLRERVESMRHEVTWAKTIENFRKTWSDGSSNQFMASQK